MFIYIHIPFCHQRCSYCRFALDPKPTSAKIATYIGALLREIDLFMLGQEGMAIESIYFGGGTPSMLPLKYIEAILEKFPVVQRPPDCEITLEGNPEDITPESALAYRDLGFTRISLGVQTLSDRALSEVGRSSWADVLSALDCLSAAGHGNINVDFMLGLPHVAEGETVAGIAMLHDRYSSITHTSVYLLEYEHSYPQSWQTLALSRLDQHREYGAIREYLRGQGFEHYEISNFARVGRASHHNRAYWDHSMVRGFGLAAASYVGGERYTNASSFPSYYRGEIVDRERLTPEQISLEKWMFGLRTLSLDPIFVGDQEYLARALSQGLLEQFTLPESFPDAGALRLRPTTTWIFELDHIMQELF